MKRRSKRAYRFPTYRSLYRRNPKLQRRGPRFAIMHMNLEHADKAFAAGFHVLEVLLIHAFAEANLRASTGLHRRGDSFLEVLEAFAKGLPRYRGRTQLLRDLQMVNNFRSRLLHELWHDGYEHANELARSRRRRLFATLRRILRLESVPQERRPL